MDNEEQKLKESVFFVEANSYEQHQIWREYAKRVDWKQDYSGFGTTVGFINNNPSQRVFVSFNFNFVFGQRVCFYDITSRFVDHTMVTDYLKYKLGVDQTNICDAQNFHNAIRACEKLSGKEMIELPKKYTLEEAAKELKKQEYESY